MMRTQAENPHMKTRATSTPSTSLQKHIAGRLIQKNGNLSSGRLGQYLNSFDGCLK